jgi:hypothetical protein
VAGLDATARAPGPLSPTHCSCLLQTVSTSIYLCVGVVLPTVLAWLSERAAKSAFLKARGCRLRVRVPFERAGTALRARCGVGVPWARVLGSPAALAAAVLLVWCSAVATIQGMSPECRGVI